MQDGAAGSAAGDLDDRLGRFYRLRIRKHREGFRRGLNAFVESRDSRRFNIA
jgi:hypothetical protein